MTDRRYVAVCGPDPAEQEAEVAAERIGRLLARAGAVVLCGGHGGVMEAVARGASSEGGTAVGILPGSDRREGNAYLTAALATGLGEMRNALLVRAADVVIAVAGEFGTLSEIALALKTGVPVVGLSTWELGRRGTPLVPDPVVRADSPEEAVEVALRLAAQRATGGRE